MMPTIGAVLVRHQKETRSVASRTSLLPPPPAQTPDLAISVQQRHIIVLGEAQLRRILRCYARYYNEIRTHRALNKDAPHSRAVLQVGIIKSHAILGGLHHQYVRI